MYTSNVDVLLSVSSLSMSPERAGTNRWLLGRLSSHLKHHMSYTCNVRKHGIILYCLTLCRSPHCELHILGYWVIAKFIKRKSAVISRLYMLRDHKKMTGACQYQPLPQKHCEFLGQHYCWQITMISVKCVVLEVPCNYILQGKPKYSTKKLLQKSNINARSKES